MSISLFRIAYKAIKNTVSPDLIQQANIAYCIKNETLSNRRILDAGEGGLVASWSRSSQNATIG